MDTVTLRCKPFADLPSAKYTVRYTSGAFRVWHPVHGRFTSDYNLSANARTKVLRLFGVILYWETYSPLSLVPVLRHGSRADASREVQRAQPVKLLIREIRP